MEHRIAAVILLALSLAGCGGEDDAPRERPRGADALTCRDIRTKAEALRVAREVDHRVVAPDGQSRRETLDAIGGSLYATCRNPAMRDARPVKPVLREVQAHFDEEAIEGR